MHCQLKRVSLGCACRPPALIALLMMAALAAAGQPTATINAQVNPVATGRFSYVTELQIGSAGSRIESIREIRADEINGRPSLSVQTTLLTGMGETVDRLWLDAETLYPQTREITQGAGRLHLSFLPQRVSGTIESAGQRIEVNLALAGPAYAGDAGLDTVLGALPLQAGLSGELDAIETDVEVHIQRFRFMVGTAEVIDTPAGRFNSWPVRVEAIDDPDYRQVIWFSTDLPRILLQAEAPVPAAAGGGRLRTRLTQVMLD